MSLQFNQADARRADSSGVIRETGKYLGIITRAEKLNSKNGVEGLGLSFKSDDGATASYLDLYTIKPDGTKLFGHNLVQSLLCVTRVKDAAEGPITFEKWDNEVREVVKATGNGYPALMGKRVGVILQKELQSHYQTGADVERINVVGFFEAASGLTASEILDGKTKPERVEQKLKALLPVRDSRKKQEPLKTMGQQSSYVDHDFNDDPKF